MIYLSKDKGITLTALVITVAIMLILTSVTLYTGKNVIKEAKENKLIADLEIVQHAVLEQYEKFKITKNTEYLKGEIISVEEVKSITGVTDLVDTTNFTNAEYRRLDPNNLKEIGIKASEDVYIVNYVTGEVFNATVKTKADGSPLYLKSTILNNENAINLD